MGELKRTDRRDRGYGIYYKTTLETEDRVIKGAWREPSGRSSGIVYTNVNGLGGPKLSMRLPAHEAVRAGHAAMTFEFTNKQRKNALDHNASDLEAVIAAIAAERYRQRVLALSMGGRVTIKSMVNVGSLVESVNLVASAGLLARDPTKREVLEHFGATVPETIGLAVRHPVQAWHLGRKATHHFLRRGLAVIGELGELIHGDEFEALRTFKAAPDAPNVSVWYGDGDKLIPDWAFEESLPGLPIDIIRKYTGGHMLLVSDPEFSREIFRQDDQLPSPRVPSRSLVGVELAVAA